MELKQQLKLSQQLVMTPQLQQAIKLLQLSRLELSDLIIQEINENPVLEEAVEPDNTQQETTASQSENVDIVTERPGQDIDWQEYIVRAIEPTPGYFYEPEEREELGPVITKKATFADHLLWQLHLHNLNEQETEIGEYIIGNLNADGYLAIELEEIAADLNVSRDLVADVQKKIMKFDPVGVAASNLEQCLIAQLEVLPGDTTLPQRIIKECMRELERKKYPVIARILKVSLREVLNACDIIAHLEPKPGRTFSDNETQYITPDIFVYKINDEYVVMLNEDGQPKLKINNFYKQVLSGNVQPNDKARDYIQEKLRSAVWLIKSVYHRRTTIINVMKSIIKFQREFFDKGIGYLKPLVLRDVAEDVGMHESNISRITTNKYVLTPHGIFELKYFFNSGLTADDGETIASESVKNKIRELIAAENPYKPLSDQEIVKALKQQGINIARRTVTKYREMLGILSSSKRKRHI
ncbi:MAG: RNA polymerase factor sigma-54 [Desulfobacterota bacterium]|nr:RNA polymerase factor sigma-54 [Thermodesulfobacteriota bacterium]